MKTDRRRTVEVDSFLTLEATKAVRDACKGLTQMQITDLTGVGQSTISGILGGTTVPTLATLEAILDGLGYDVTLRVRRREQ